MKLMIARKILPYLTRKQVKKPPVSRHSTPFEQVQHVGILFSFRDKKKYQEISRLVEELKAQGKKVQVLGYKPKEIDNPEFRFDFFEEDDLSFFGKLESDSINTFLSEQFDYLFFLDKEASLYMENILARSKAHCRVAINQPEDKRTLFELMIDPKSDSIRELIDEIMRYVKRIG